MVKLCILGAATDGPTNEFTTFSSPNEFLRTFGNTFNERFILSINATSLNLAFAPLNGGFTNVVGGTRSQWLYGAYATNKKISFDRLGYLPSSTATSVVVDIQYTPYLGKSDMLWGVKKFFELKGRQIDCCRIGGKTAAFADGSFVLKARYPGSKYNKLFCKADGTSLTISGMRPEYDTLTYTGSTQEIKSKVFNDFQLGISPVYIPSITSTLPTASGFFSGGSDAVDESSVISFFELSTIPYDITHMMFLTPLTSAIVTAYDSYVNSGGRPVVLIFPSEYNGEDVLQWCNTKTASIPQRHDMITSVIGTVDSSLNGILSSRYSAEAASFALIEKDNLTNVPVTVENWYPKLDEASLIRLKAAGFMALTRYILNDVSVWQGINSTADFNFPYITKIAEVHSAITLTVNDYIGKILPEGQQPQIESLLSNRLSSIPNLIIDVVAINVLLDSIYVSVEGMVFNEILSIEFTLRNRL